MAKSARASTRKRNNANLRTKVFGPAFDARTERLSAKLQELANAPKPDEEKKMEVDEAQPTGEEAEKASLQADDDEAMQWAGVSSTRKSKSSKSSGRISKIAKRKPRNQVVFPSEMARKKRQAKSKKS